MRLMINVTDEELYEYRRLVEHFLVFESVLSSALSIDDIIHENPEKAWQVIKLGIRTIPSPILFQKFVKDYLSMFLSLHGKKYLKQIEDELNDSPNFCNALEIALNYKSYFWKIPKQVITKLKSMLSLKNADFNIEKDNDQIQNIINSWLVYETTSWADDDLDKYVRSNPDLVFQLIVELVRYATSKHTLAYIAAGSLEDLLSKHPYQIIEKVEVKAAESQRFRLCLSGVWKRDIPDEIWERMTSAVKDDWLDDWEGDLPND